MYSLRAQSIALVQGLKATRSISSSRVNNGVLDYLKFFNKGKNSKDLTKEGESREVQEELQKNAVEKGKHIRVLGVNNPKYYNKKLVSEKLINDGFLIHRWIPKDTVYSKRLAELEQESSLNDSYIPVVEKLLLEIYSTVYQSNLNTLTLEEFQGVKLDDLSLRFQFIKAIQVNFGLTISDFELTHLNDLYKVRQLLVAELNPSKIIKNEKLPNAIYLNKDDFKGSNVSIQDHVFESEKKKTMKKLMKKARKNEIKAEAKFITDQAQQSI